MIKNFIAKYRRSVKQKKVCLHVKNILREREIKTVIDVGANKGEFSLAALKVFERAKVYSFEPLPLLIKNHLSKIKEKRFAFFELALSNKNSTNYFNYNVNRKRRSSLLENVGERNLPIKKIKIKTKRFDSLNVPLNKPCFLKIDVEGAEMLVLKGFGGKLNQVDILQIEVNFSDNFKHQAKISELVNLLEKYNFKRFIQKNIIYKSRVPQSCDLIFFK